MAIARSKLTAQGQISVPAEVRKKLVVGPGSILKWDESNDQVVLRRAEHHSSAEVHEALFGAEQPKRLTVKDIKAGIRSHMRKKHTRR